MRISFLITLFLSLAFTVHAGESLVPTQSKSDQYNHASNNKPKEKKSKPILIEIVPAPDADAKAAKEEKKENEKLIVEHRVAKYTLWLTIITALLAIFTGALWWVTLQLSRKADETGKQQMADVQKSIVETSRAATAMERVAVHMEISARASTESVSALKERTAQQMRAYLSVSIGGGIYQDSFSKLRFEVKPMLLNSGHTPAHKITYWARAAILPVPLPDEFQFPPVVEETQSSYVLGPSQSIELNAMVEGYVADAEVEDIKRGIGKSPYIWGIVTYADVFGVNHVTKFCHSIHWIGPIGKEIIYGTYARKHNEAT